MYKQRRRPGEALGDFTARVGFAALKQYAKVIDRTPFSAITSGPILYCNYRLATHSLGL